LIKQNSNSKPYYSTYIKFIQEDHGAQHSSVPNQDDMFPFRLKQTLDFKVSLIFADFLITEIEKEVEV